MQKISEVLRNTPVYNFGTNGVEWMLRALMPRNSALRPETQVLHLYTLKCSETHLNITLGIME
jgi:hypothetical protein